MTVFGSLSSAPNTAPTVFNTQHTTHHAQQDFTKWWVNSWKGGRMKTCIPTRTSVLFQLQTQQVGCSNMGLITGVNLHYDGVVTWYSPETGSFHIRTPPQSFSHHAPQLWSNMCEHHSIRSVSSWDPRLPWDTDQERFRFFSSIAPSSEICRIKI